MEGQTKVDRLRPLNDLMPHRCLNALEDIKALFAHALTDSIDMVERIQRICDDALNTRSPSSDGPTNELRVAVALEREFPECVDEGRMGFIQRLARAAVTTLARPSSDKRLADTEWEGPAYEYGVTWGPTLTEEQVREFVDAADYYIAGLQAVQRKTRVRDLGERHVAFDRVRTAILASLRSTAGEMGG